MPESNAPVYILLDKYVGSTTTFIEVSAESESESASLAVDSEDASGWRLSLMPT